jgi:hypothetical protein
MISRQLEANPAKSLVTLSRDQGGVNQQWTLAEPLDGAAKGFKMKELREVIRRHKARP